MTPLHISDLLNMRLNESCFPDCWKDSSENPIFKTDKGRWTLRTTTMKVFFLHRLKLREKFNNHRLVEQSQKGGSFSDISDIMRPYCRTSNLFNLYTAAVNRLRNFPISFVLKPTSLIQPKLVIAIIITKQLLTCRSFSKA